jgi:poly(3-hydroxybutyrate) depolymerase
MRRRIVKSNLRVTAAIAIAGLSAGLALIAPSPAQGQPPAPNGRGGSRFTQDPRAETRMYHFDDTNVDLPYSLYVSTKVTKDKKAPLVVSLHGLGATQTIMMTKAAVDLAEEGGYILVSPLGYNTGGWYGSPVINTNGRGRGRGAGAAPGQGGGNAPTAAPPAPRPENPPNLAELSEKDVMNVIAMVRKEFNVDDKRMYLMGHSMGGAGTIFLGSKYASMWAAIGAEAPADFMLNNTRTEILQRMKDASLPVMIVQGDMDEAVPVTNTRMWVDTMKELKLNYEYVEQPGVTHGPVIESGLKPIYAFFAQHTKK